MSAEQRAYDMGRFQRIVGVDGPRVSGIFTALSTTDGGDTIVNPLVVTIYDEHRHGGIILRSDDLTAWVRAATATVDIPDHMVRDRVRYDLDEVREEFVSAVRAVADAALFEWRTAPSTDESEEWEYGIQPEGADPRHEGITLITSEGSARHVSPAFIRGRGVRRRPAGPWEPIPESEEQR